MFYYLNDDHPVCSGTTEEWPKYIQRIKTENYCISEDLIDKKLISTRGQFNPDYRGDFDPDVPVWVFETMIFDTIYANEYPP